MDCQDTTKGITESQEINNVYIGEPTLAPLKQLEDKLIEELNMKNPATTDELSGKKLSSTMSTHSESPTPHNYEFEFEPVVLPEGQMAKKLEMAAPYYMFLTTVTASKPTHCEPLSITIQEILDCSLGEPESSVQMNFMVDIEWLLKHYRSAGWGDTPLLVIYGYDETENQTISQPRPFVTTKEIETPGPLGCHHTKIMLLGYKDGTMRVVVSSANLYERDWHNRTQGVWISPTLRRLPLDNHMEEGDSSTGFRKNLMTYLAEYKLSELQPWIERIQKTDFSSVRVFLVTSLAGTFEKGTNGYPWGHPQFGSILKEHCPPMEESCPIVAQSSSMGSYNSRPGEWLYNNLVNSLSNDKSNPRIRYLPEIQVIFPTVRNMLQGHNGIFNATVNYRGKHHRWQTWLEKYLYQWKLDGRHRSQAMPHIKTYFRYSGKGLHWFLLTSANLSRSAWGHFHREREQIEIFNYEAGVLFLPNYMIDKDVFPIGEANEDGDPPFPLPFDLPLIRYEEDDKPCTTDEVDRIYEELEESYEEIGSA